MRRWLPLGHILGTVLLWSVAGCQSDGLYRSHTNGGLLASSAVSKPNKSGASFELPSQTKSADGFVLTDDAEIKKNEDTQTRESTDQNPPSIILNLNNVPISQAAQQILGDTLGVPYSADNSIQGQITIQTPQPVSRSDAFQLFDNALRGNGAALQNQDGFFRIVPIDQIGQGAIFSSSGSTKATEGGSFTQIVPIHFISANELKRVLDPIASRGASITPVSGHNSLMLTAPAQELRSLQEAIALFDVDAFRDVSFALIPVKQGQPESIADDVKVALGLDRDGPMADILQIVPNKHLGALLVISKQKAYLARVQDLVRKLERQAQLTEKRLFTYIAQNRRASELVSIVQSMFPNEFGTGSSTSGSTSLLAPKYGESSPQSTDGQSDTKGSGISALGSGGNASGSGSNASGSGSNALGSSNNTSSDAFRPTVASDSPNNASGSAQSTPSNGQSSPRMRIAVDETNNALLIQASREDYKRVARVLSDLDSVPRQVMIEATIAEVTLTDAIKFGVRWYLQTDNTAYTFSNDKAGAVTSTFPGFSYALNSSNVQASLNALNSITTVNVISSPSLMVLDNKTATLQIGDQVPITTQSAVSVAGSGTPIVNSVGYRDTGVILSVTPRINDSGKILLNIEQEVSSVANTTSSNIDSPTISQRRIRSSVLINDGDALILGGLMQDKKTIGRDQVPLLGDIPLIGNVFKNKSNTIDKTELVIIITPRITRENSDTRQITDEFLRRFSSEDIGRQTRPSSSLSQKLHRTLE